VPSGTPKEITTLLSRRVADIIAQPAMKEQLAALGFQPVGNTPEEFAAQIRTDIVKRAKLIRNAGIRAQ
jgi:tripartite-type tricarboxylate transporter receptor subunit TctC